jgi:hypothetical protein
MIPLPLRPESPVVMGYEVGDGRGAGVRQGDGDMLPLEGRDGVSSGIGGLGGHASGGR